MNVNLNAFLDCRILVVGDVMLDQYWHGLTQRISPEAPVPVVAVQQEEYRLGGAANTALNTASLGAQTTIIGIAGQDTNSGTLCSLLEAAQIKPKLHHDASLHTITKLRVISQNQQLIRADFERDIDAHCGKKIVELSQASLANIDVLLLSDYGKGTLSSCSEIIEAARKQGKTILVDPKGTDFDKYRGATLLTPNLNEFETIVGHCKTEAQLIERAQKLTHELDLQALLVTRSEKGMTLVTRGGITHHFPTRAKEVYDVTGAGDTVIATLAVALGSGLDMETAAALANIAAGIVVGKLGTAAITVPDLKQALDRDDVLEKGVLTEEQLVIAVRQARENGSKIVFTNGCFDILHAGHVSYLDDAQNLGDKLIVAVNSDQSVKDLKGPGRPVNTLDRRMIVLGALKAVDWVVSFSDQTPEALLELIKPDVLVKGGDYELDQVVGAEFIQSYGGEVKVIAVQEDCSTTATINHIINHP